MWSRVSVVDQPELIVLMCDVITDLQMVEPRTWIIQKNPRIRAGRPTGVNT